MIIIGDLALRDFLNLNLNNYFENNLNLIVIIVLILYFLLAFFQKKLAGKEKISNSWLAFVPYGNFYLLIRNSKVSRWWFLLVVPVFLFSFLMLSSISYTVLSLILLFGIGFILCLVVPNLLFVWACWRIFVRFKQPGWLSLFMLIPVVNVILLGMLANSKTT